MKKALNYSVYTRYEKIKDHSKEMGISTHMDSEDIISFFFGDKKILVINAKEIKKDNRLSEYTNRISGGLFIFFDPNFQTLSKIIEDTEMLQDIKSNKQINKGLYNLFKMFSPKLNKTKKDKLDNYNKLYDYDLKLFFSQIFKIPFTGNKEFFLFYDDELRPRYESKIGKNYKIKGRQRIKIKDKSARLYIKSGPSKKVLMFIDMYDNRNYVVGEKYFYKLNHLVRMVKSGKEKSDVVSFSPNNGDKKYYKYKQKKLNKKQLENEPYMLVKELHDKEFILKFDKKNKNFYLLDNKDNKISLSHPDLLIELL